MGDSMKYKDNKVKKTVTAYNKGGMAKKIKYAMKSGGFTKRGPCK
jgi:hypothetical protein